MFLGGNEAVNNTMHQQLPASSYAGLPHAPTIQQVNNLGPVNPEPQSPINPALMAQPNQQQMQVKLRHYEKATKSKYPACFDKTAVFTQWRHNKWEIFSNFCGLLRKA